MAVNFRLAYNSGLEYVDLFLKSSLQAVENTENVLKYSTINVTIPAVAENTVTQTIDIATTNSQLNSPVDMYLLSTGKNAQNDYATITQYEVTQNQLAITRLYNWPTDSIDVVLVFKEKGVE